MNFLFVDRIVHLVPGESIQGIKHVCPDDAYLTTDEYGKPCFISSFIGETLGQLAAWNVMLHHEFALRPVAGLVTRAQLFRKAYVGETIFLESYIDKLDTQAVHYHSKASINGEVIFSLENALGPLLPMNDFIDIETVKRQFNEIYRPTEFAYPSSSKSNCLIQESPKCFPMNFDTIVHCEAGVSLIAEKRISRSAPYFADHFPYKPVLPMTVLLECISNLAVEFLARSQNQLPYVVKELRKIKMNDFVHPGDIIFCHLSIKKQTDEELILNFQTEVDEKRVCIVDVVLGLTP